MSAQKVIKARIAELFNSIHKLHLMKNEMHPSDKRGIKRIEHLIFLQEGLINLNQRILNDLGE